MQKLLAVIIYSFFIVTILIFAYAKNNFIFTQLADHAIFAQSIDNIIDTGIAKSNIFAACQYLIDKGIAGLSLVDLNDLNLSGQNTNDRYLFPFHADFILYVIVPFSLILGSDIAIIFFQIFNILLLFIFISKSLSSYKTPKIIIFIFILLSSCNPLILGNLLGQFYPDRLFIAPMFLLLLFLNEKEINYFYVFTSFLFITIINERASIYLALTFFYFFLIRNNELFEFRNIKFYITKNKQLRDFKLIYFGVGSLIYFFLIKTFLISNIYYSGFIPRSFSQLYSLLINHQFQINSIYFLLNISPFLILSFFNKKFFFLTLLSITPNLVGNIGGAEKVNWLTHYHSYYIPFIFFSSVVGLNKILKCNKKLLIFIFVFLSLLFSNYLLLKNNIYSIKNSFKYMSDIVYNTIQYPFSKIISLQSSNEILKIGDKVSTTELGMSFLHNQGVNFYYFPIQYKNVDWIFIPCLGSDKKYHLTLDNLSFVKKIDSIQMCFYKNNV